MGLLTTYLGREVPYSRNPPDMQGEYLKEILSSRSLIRPVTIQTDSAWPVIPSMTFSFVDASLDA